MDVSERSKAIELIKEMREGRDDSENQGNGMRLTWMYKGPSELVDKEEYLLGKAIDKSFNADKTNDNSDLIGRIYEQSNVPKRLLSKPESTEQVDVAKKIHEDPLYAIKQKELEARRRLLDNPVKLKELKKMIMERKLLKSQKKREKKKKMKKDAMKDEKYLNKLILKKLKILSEKQRKKLLEEAAQISDSSDSDRKKIKKRIVKSEHSAESVSEKDSSDSSDDNKRRKKKLTGSSNKQSNFSVEYASRSSQRSRKDDKIYKSRHRSPLKKEENKMTRTRGHKKHWKSSRESSSQSNSTNYSSSSSSSSSSSDSSGSSGSSSDGGNSKKRNKTKKRKMNVRESPKSSYKSKRTEKIVSSKGEKKDQIRKMKRHYSKDESSSSSSSSNNSEDERSERNRRKRQEYNQKANDWSRAKNFADRRKPGHGSGSNYRENCSSSHLKQVSEKERECALKEMMANAKVRKAEREQNLANHRRIQTEEEKLKDYDDGFMRRQISQATSQGTVADRIRSNVNNIQRSKSDMDRSFVRK